MPSARNRNLEGYEDQKHILLLTNQKTWLTKTTAGYDLISAELITNLPKKATILLTGLFNAALKWRHYPSA